MTHPMCPNRPILRRIALLAGAVASLAIPLAAQDAPPASDPPADPPKQTEPAKPASETPAKPDADKPESATPPADPLDLDELLRIPGSGGPVDRPANADEPESELERRLTGRQAQEALVQAVQEMSEVADRLDQLRDAGVVTQRLQQEIITKLDVLIKSAESQQNQSSSSSSSQQQQQNQQAAQQQTQQSQTPGQAAQSGETPPPGRLQEQLNQNVDLTVAEWGNLPERLRESLIQGQSDYFSDMYKRWTESYYRRLAEEASR